MKTFSMITLLSAIVLTMMPTISSAERVRNMYACEVDACEDGLAYDFYWYDLCDEQRLAAEVLGYNEDDWDCLDDECVDERDEVLTHLSWANLPPIIRGAYETLCFTEESWEQNKLKYIEEDENEDSA
mmetsp:Transcript_20291/g.29777  ORF Transcript_20291/g.29777 Transcript_20291/m.29777 type:complete len:128 (+) Transcript_20291:89-472(+)|eukprot:CAMPEP_0195508120 /NCGR_PEP_ID=MMETSP0794_2-20130614/1416_1 /TAXON_ID=515487 /ORGANISM="Stephanopyxis turris, Strain CCMP 815" /LENGTH=127 /DNA_ID=CAMNT_0040635001 /DNA_START=89 /DNA_END=472 /DNA_ORIENTATION=-